MVIMTRYQRAAQLWSVLVFAAREQHILSYELTGKLTGLPERAVGENLSPIQDYCKQNGLPPLTVLVVSEKTGVPGGGFTAAQDILPAQARVFVYDWLSLRRTPTPEDFEQAARKAKH
jgi:hypothetical protein